MKNTKSFSLVLVIGLMLGFATPAHATWTPSYYGVDQVQVRDSGYDNGNAYVTLNGYSCSGGGSFVILGTRQDKFELVKLLLTAMLSGGTVKLGYSSSGNNCSIYAVAFRKA